MMRSSLSRRTAAALLAVPALALLLAVATGAPAEPANLVANGDFSQATGGKPDKWDFSGDANVTQSLGVAQDDKGRPSAKLVCTRCDQKSPSSHAMLAQVGVVTLVKGRLYEFSCRAKAEGLRGRAVEVAIQDTRGWTNAGLFGSLRVGSEWKTFNRTFFAAQDVGPTSRLQIWFHEPGTLYVADVRIVECPQREVEFTDVVPPAGGKNLVRNGSFEVGAAGWASLGTGAGWGDLDHLHGSVETGDAPHGRSFLRISVGGDHTPLMYFDYYEPVAKREIRPLAAGRGWIKVEKGAPYTLSCSMRATDDGVPAVLGIESGEPDGRLSHQRLTVRLTKQWQRYTFTVRPDHGYAYPVMGPNLSEERAVAVDVDAVQLEKGEQATAFEPRAAVEFALDPSQAGGIFVEGQPAALRLRACNHGPAAVRAAVAFTIADYEDRPVAWPNQTLELPPGEPTARDLPLPPEWKGYFRVRATAEAGGRTETHDLRLAIVPRRTADDSVLGFNHAFPASYLIHLASKAGVTWYRDWSLKWQHVEPKPGEFHWDVADVQIDRVLKEGVHVVPLLPPFPSANWSSTAPDGLPATGYPGVRLRQAFAPKDPAELGRFVGQAVERYRNRIHVWDFLNEPIYTDYSLPAGLSKKYGGKAYTPADYAALLKIAAAAMHKADPGCKVLGGIGSGPLNMTREVIEAGCLQYADLFNLHIYPGARSPEGYAADMDTLLEFMDVHGGRKPIWITEFSYYGTDDLPRRPFFPSPHTWSEPRLLENERQCADFTVRFFAVMLSRGVEKIFIHAGGNGRVNEPNFECALFADQGAPRKLLPALAVFTDLAGPAPKPAGNRRLGDAGWAVAFEAGKHALVAFWQDGDAPATVAAPAAADVRCLDIMGRTIPAQPVRLSSSPVYLVGPAGKAKTLLEALRIAAPSQ